MKRLNKVLALALGVATTIGLASCGSKDKTIKVAASDVPHAEVLNGAVKDILKEQGYELEVTILDWTLQNDAVANGDYDANYFQHVPYLETYTGTVELFASCKVHYEPLGIYAGKSGATLAAAKTVEICDDESNAIRALQLLKNKNVITDLPVANDKLTFTGTKWTSANGVEVTLVAENLLVSSKADYDLALLPCNTALTGNVSADTRLAVEDDPAQVSLKANVLAARKNDYNTNDVYKKKIDVLTDALLSKEVSDFVKTKYNGVITCDSSSQIDLRK